MGHPLFFEPQHWLHRDTVLGCNGWRSQASALLGSVLKALHRRSKSRTSYHQHTQLRRTSLA